MITFLAGGSFAAALLLGARWAIWRGFEAPRTIGSETPRDFGLDHAEIVIPTVGGRRLRGWLMTAGRTAPVVIVVHGWGADAASLLPVAAPLRRHGYSVLMFDARSHGRSDPDTFSSMPRFAEDAEAALAWVAAHPGLAPASITLLGHSVGGAAVLLTASRRSDLGAVVSLSAFDHPERVMRATLARGRIPYRPLGWLICRYVERVIGHRFDDIAPVTTIGRVRCPVLLGHGADDRVVPPEAALAIQAGAADARCEVAILPATGHDGSEDFDGIGAALIAFLDRVLDGTAASGETKAG